MLNNEHCCSNTLILINMRLQQKKTISRDGRE